MRIKHEVVIDRPLEEVWAFMEDMRNYSRWLSGLVTVQRLNDGPMGVGARIAVVQQFLGRRVDVMLEVTRFERPRLFSARVVSGPIRCDGTWRYESVAGGTRISGTIDCDTEGFFKHADRLVARVAKRQIDADCATLKDLLESSLGSAA